MVGKNLPIKDIIQWDTYNWAKCLYFWEKYLPEDLSSAKGLEIGSNMGGLSLWMALKGMDVICSDIEDPKEKALPLHKKYGVEERIEYKAIDAISIPYEDYFDIIAFKSVLGGIGVGDPILQAKTVEQVYKALKPGGRLLFAENLAASNLHQYLRKRFVSWENTWRYFSLSEIKDLLSLFPTYEYITAGFLGTFGRVEGQRIFLGALDGVLDKLVPENWRYIIIGVAFK